MSYTHTHDDCSVESRLCAVSALLVGAVLLDGDAVVGTVVAGSDCAWYSNTTAISEPLGCIDSLCTLDTEGATVLLPKEEGCNGGDGGAEITAVSTKSCTTSA